MNLDVVPMKLLLVLTVTLCLNYHMANSGIVGRREFTDKELDELIQNQTLLSQSSFHQLPRSNENFALHQQQFLENSGQKLSSPSADIVLLMAREAALRRRRRATLISATNSGNRDADDIEEEEEYDNDEEEEEGSGSMDAEQDDNDLEPEDGSGDDEDSETKPVHRIDSGLDGKQRTDHTSKTKFTVGSGGVGDVKPPPVPPPGGIDQATIDNGVSHVLEETDSGGHVESGPDSDPGSVSGMDSAVSTSIPAVPSSSGMSSGQFLLIVVCVSAIAVVALVMLIACLIHRKRTSFRN